MAQLKDLIVSGATRCVGKLYAPEIIGNLTGTASKAIADQRNQTIDSTYVKSITSSDGVTVTITKGDNTTSTFDVTGTEYSLGTSSTLGLTKLYDGLGNNADGTITQAGIKSIIDSLHQFEIQIVDSLPVEGTSHILYFVPFQDGDEDTLYEEYVWITTVDAETSEPTGYFEKVGMTTADLGNYYTSSEVDGLLADKLDIDTYWSNIATEYVPGITKVYSTTGYNSDGTMSQYAITNALSDLLISPALTGTPTAPSVSDPEDNTTKIATTEFVQNAIQVAIENLIESGVFKASAATAQGEALGTAELELLTFNVTASSEDSEE